MSNHRLIPAGATIARTYLAIPGTYVVGDEFENDADGWTAAVTAAQAKKADLVASLTESMRGYATPADVERTANTQVRIDLRWQIAYPDGGGTDTVVESYTDVDKLRASV